MNVRQIVRKALCRVGVEVRQPAPGRLLVQRTAPGRAALARDTLRGSLENARAAGFAPLTVIDVGAASGTPPLYDVFPGARHLLIEPLQEFAPALRRISSGLDAAIFTGTAGAEVGEAVFHVHPDLNGSSLLREREDTDVNGYERRVAQSTLDVLCRREGLSGPFLLKVDTQGGELEVLKGAEEHVLPQTGMAVLEVSFMPFFEGGPQVLDVVDFMRERGFVPYDVIDHQYRPLDGAMSQVDVIFVPESSLLRRRTHYATSEQRAAQNHAFRQHHARIGASPVI